MEDFSFIFWVSKVCVHTISLTEATLPLDDCAQMLIIQHHHFHRKLLHKDCHQFLPMRRYTEQIDIHWTSLSFFGLTKHHVEFAKKRESPNTCWVMVTNFQICTFLQSWYQLQFDTWLPLRGLLSWLPWKPQLVSSRFYMHVCIVIDLQENLHLLFPHIVEREMRFFFSSSVNIHGEASISINVNDRNVWICGCGPQCSWQAETHCS